MTDKTERRDAERLKDMLATIAEEAAETASFTGREAFAPRVMEAMANVPRHLFVPPGQEPVAYVNGPLPIGYGQTISQPFIVALMTDLLDLQPGMRVLEVGTGSGYQTAVLAELGAEVYSLEIVPELARSAAERLARLGYERVHVKAADGYEGWSEHAPFERIIVTAAAPAVPPPLLDQLGSGGRLVIPVGAVHVGQTLAVVDKDAAGHATERPVLPVAFVPLTRSNGGY